MTFLDLPQTLLAAGRVVLPGSKSISNRALLLAALAEGETRIRRLLISDDTRRMSEALQQLGVSIHQEQDEWLVQGVDGRFPITTASLFLGNAGTAFRSLTAVLALSNGHYHLHGTDRMHQRPIGDLTLALRSLGAQIDEQQTAGFPPLDIAPFKADSGACFATDGNREVRVNGSVSSQFLSALLMALPLTKTAYTVRVEGELISRPYVALTIALMAQFGVTVREEGDCFYLPANAAYRSPGVFQVEADASSASYFLALGALSGPVRVEGVGQHAIQGDIRFVDVLAQMGAQVTRGDDFFSVSPPRHGRLQGCDIDCNDFPDAAMTLAPLALFAEGQSRLRNIASWRVKECDRLHAMGCELKKFGADVIEGEDELRINPRPSAAQYHPAMVDTYDDHRMAMSLSLLSCAVPLRINDPACVNKTYPDYFADFAQLMTPAPVIAIDGPAASGKGSVAQRVAQHLGFHYLDSGALYRLTALAALRQQIAWNNEDELAALAARLDVRFADDEIYLFGAAAAHDIRRENIGNAASQIAALPKVRTALLFLQRTFRRAPGLVADGRDMASTVFPDAEVKIFLTASAEIRAQRRYKQLKEKGFSANLSALCDELKARDLRDSQRQSAPLRQADDAVLINSDQLDLNGVVAAVLALTAQVKSRAS